jgi:hypothetical protein
MIVIIHLKTVILAKFQYIEDQDKQSKISICFVRVLNLVSYDEGTTCNTVSERRQY